MAISKIFSHTFTHNALTLFETQSSEQLLPFMSVDFESNLDGPGPIYMHAKFKLIQMDSLHLNISKGRSSRG